MKSIFSILIITILFVSTTQQNIDYQYQFQGLYSNEVYHSLAQQKSYYLNKPLPKEGIVEVEIKGNSGQVDVFFGIQPCNNCQFRNTGVFSNILKYKIYIKNGNISTEVESHPNLSNSSYVKYDVYDDILLYFIAFIPGTTIKFNVITIIPNENAVDYEYPYPDMVTEQMRRRFSQQLTDQHNKQRRLHGVPDLRIDQGLERSAQLYAEELARRCNGLVHSTRDWQRQFSLQYPLGLGENIGYNSLYTNGRKFGEGYYGEIAYYDFNTHRSTNPRCKVGHFTQVVWKESEKTGTGVAMCTNSSGMKLYFSVTHFYPPGNYVGMNEFSVFKPTHLEMILQSFPKEKFCW